MSDERLSAREWDAGVKAAELAAMAYPDVDKDEVLSELGEWMARNWAKIHRWRDEDGGFRKYMKAVNQEAKNAAHAAHVLNKGGDPETHYRYGRGEIRRLLLQATDEAWTTKPGRGYDDMPSQTPDPTKSTDWWDGVLDVRDAYYALTAHGRAVIDLAVAQDFEYAAIAEWMSVAEGEPVSENAATLRVQRQIDRMREYLGQPSARVYGDYVGTRNMPEYSFDAARQERAEINDWMG